MTTLGRIETFADSEPVEIDYPNRLLPVEIIRRSELLARSSGTGQRQRVGFHQLIVCTGGHGMHWVDFEPIDISTGSVTIRWT